jgi:hypothetical protein
VNQWRTTTGDIAFWRECGGSVSATGELALVDGASERAGEPAKRGVSGNSIDLCV